MAAEAPITDPRMSPENPEPTPGAQSTEPDSPAESVIARPGTEDHFVDRRMPVF